MRAVEPREGGHVIRKEGVWRRQGVKGREPRRGKNEKAGKQTRSSGTVAKPGLKYVTSEKGNRIRGGERKEKAGVKRPAIRAERRSEVGGQGEWRGKEQAQKGRKIKEHVRKNVEVGNVGRESKNTCTRIGGRRKERARGPHSKGRKMTERRRRAGSRRKDGNWGGSLHSRWERVRNRAEKPSRDSRM